MKDFAESRTTYYSLVRERLMGKHPRMFNLLLILILISMTGLAAFLISDILSFGFNSDHKSILAGIELQDPIRSTVSAASWNEKRINLVVKDDTRTQKKDPNSILIANSSPKRGDLNRLAANASGKENNSVARMEDLSHKTGEANSSNSSRIGGSSSSGQSSGYITIKKVVLGTSSGKAVDQKKTATTATAITAIKHHSSSGKSSSKSQTQKNLVQNQKDANSTKTNNTNMNSNSTKANSNDTKANSNSTKVNTTETNITKVKDISADHLQKNGIPANILPANVTSINQSHVSQSSARESQSKEDRTIAGPAITETAKYESGNENGLAETENNQLTPNTPAANLVETVSVEAHSSVDQAAPADQAALAKSAAASRSDPAEDTFAEKSVVKIEFKTDSTADESEKSLGGDHTDSGSISSTKAPSDASRAERIQARYNKNVVSRSKDSTSISKSEAKVKRSESAQNAGTVTYVKTKTKQLQESKSQQVAKRNRIAEDTKKRTIRSREGTM